MVFLLCELLNPLFNFIPGCAIINSIYGQTSEYARKNGGHSMKLVQLLERDRKSTRLNSSHCG